MQTEQSVYATYLVLARIFILPPAVASGEIAQKQGIQRVVVHPSTLSNVEIIPI